MDGLRLALARIGLPAWFVAIDLLWITRLDILGIDAYHYQKAANAWLAGGDPWAVTEGGGIHYAAAPHTLLFYVPTSILPLAAAAAIWVILGLVASIWLVRRLGVPLWWLAFPPLVQSIWNGNPQTIVLALLVVGGSAAAAVAVLLKLYAAVPLLVRPRALLVALVALVVLLPILPWRLYLDDGLGISGHLATAWNGSAWRIPILLPPTVLALWILRRDGAEWYAVPAAWPATQFYYVAMALPAVVRRPVLAAAFALPLPLVVPVSVMALAAHKVWREGRSALAIRPILGPLPTPATAPGTGTGTESRSLAPPTEPAKPAATDS
jgi:hypothetical protein